MSLLTRCYLFRLNKFVFITAAYLYAYHIKGFRQKSNPPQAAMKLMVLIKHLYRDVWDASCNNEVAKTPLEFESCGHDPK